MKKICLSVLIVLFSVCMLIPLTANGATVDDVYNKIQDEGTNMDYQIWNYINNELMPNVQASGGGSSQESVDKLQESVDNIDVKKGVGDFFDEKNTENDGSTGNSVVSFADTMIETANSYWLQIADVISDTGINNNFGFAINVKAMRYSPLFNIFKNFAYSLVLVFFAANLIEMSIKYEIFTLKGGVQVLGRQC